MGHTPNGQHQTGRPIFLCLPVGEHNIDPLAVNQFAVDKFKIILHVDQTS